MIKRQSTRLPLIRFFSVALSIILTLFILVSWLTFSKLLSFESLLINISDQALPEVALTSELHIETSRLLQFTDLLASAHSDAAKRLAEQQLNSYMNNIKGLSNNKLKNQFLDTQLNIINLELLEFSHLIWQRAKVNTQLENNKNKLYNYFSSAFNIIPNSNAEVSSGNRVWETEMPQLMILIEQAMSTKQLQIARGHFASAKQKIAIINASVEKSSKRVNILDGLNNIIFDINGLEALIISQLKLNGRVLGRENFIRHLIEDFSRLLELTINDAQEKLIQKVTSSVSQSKQQIQMIGFTITIAITLLFGVLFFIQQRVLKRLKNFNLMVQSKTQGVVYAGLLKGNDEITDLVDTFNEFALTIENQKEKLKLMSLTDGLTGIANRRALDIRLQHDIELSIRQKTSVAVLLIDIDCFKVFNDNYGHFAGDECLKSVANSMAQTLHRESDFIARFGGEEFICILPNTDRKGAEEITGQIFAALKQLNAPHKFSDVSDAVTISAGIAVSDPKQVLLPEAIIKQADKALYKAKNTGKNTFTVYSAET